MFYKKPVFTSVLPWRPNPALPCLSDFWSPMQVKQQFPIILKTHKWLIFTQELFIWAREHYFSRLLGAPGGLPTSCPHLLTENNFFATWHRHNITWGENFLSDHRLMCHLPVGPPSSYLASGGPTRNMRLRKSVFRINRPLPLSHHISYCCLQSRYSTKCNVLKI